MQVMLLVSTIFTGFTSQNHRGQREGIVKTNSTNPHHVFSRFYSWVGPKPKFIIASWKFPRQNWYSTDSYHNHSPTFSRNIVQSPGFIGVTSPTITIMYLSQRMRLCGCNNWCCVNMIPFLSQFMTHFLSPSPCLQPIIATRLGGYGLNGMVGSVCGVRYC